MSTVLMSEIKRKIMNEKPKPILTALVGDNSDLFARAVSLYLHDGDRVLDMTYGLGVFWRKIDQSRFDLIRNDIAPELGDYHDDLRQTRWPTDSLDAVVLDPPYASRSGSSVPASVDRAYKNREFALDHRISGIAAMMEFYFVGMAEAYRLLHKGGILFVKCMDIVESGKQERNHITIWMDALQLGYRDEDLFVMVQKGIPTMRHKYQIHARKNHSYLWVFRKK